MLGRLRVDAFGNGRRKGRFDPVFLQPLDMKPDRVANVRLNAAML